MTVTIALCKAATPPLAARPRPRYRGSVSERRSDPAALAHPADGHHAGFAAFFVRSEAIRRGHGVLVRHTIVEKGFEILITLEVVDALKASLSHWLAAQGQATDADTIATVLIAFDLMPIVESEPKEIADETAENERIAIAMRAADKEANRLSGAFPYVPVTASASSREAWSLLEALAPERVDAIQEQIAAGRVAFATAPPLRELSSVACRAKVELIEYNRSLAVRKTFRPGAERYLVRELEVLEELGPYCDGIPRLLEHGPNYLITEYIDEADQLGLPRREELLPLQLIRQLAAFVKICVSYGFDPVDLKPDGNAIFTPHGLKVIDYEFWRRCPPDTRPEDCYCLAGLPPDYDGDRPMGLTAPFSPYPDKWIPFTGLSLLSFLYDPLWLQRLKRAGWPAFAIVRRAARFAARRVRPSRTAPRSG